MNDGAASDKTRDEAWLESRGCPYCSGSGQVLVFAAGYDGRRVVERECSVHGEVKTIPYAMSIAAHCVCAIGRWMRSKADREVILRIPDFMDVLAGRSRFVARDRTRDEEPAGRGVDPARARRELAEKMTAR